VPDPTGELTDLLAGKGPTGKRWEVRGYGREGKG